MGSVIKLNRQAILTYLKSAGRHYGIDEDDDIMLEFGNDNNEFACWIDIQGDGTCLHMFAQQVRKYTTLEPSECLAACNEWNAGRLAAPLTLVTQPDGRRFYRTEWAVDLGVGVYDELFGDMMETFFAASGLCFDWLRDNDKY